MRDLWQKNAEAYQGVREIFSRYWCYYGGYKALITSPYLHAAVVLSVLTLGLWNTAGWWATVLRVVPGVLGFSLGGYAILLAVGDERFRSILSGPSQQNGLSPFLEVNASFVHFIVLQVLAILLALLAAAWAPAQPGIITYAFWWFGYLAFLYALLSALAATMQILRLAGWYDVYQAGRKSADKTGK